MKLIQYYEEQHISNLVEFIHQYSFGTLIFLKDGQNYATHAPFLMNIMGVKDNTKLYCHPSYGNPIINEIINGLEVVCLFQGPSCYISPKWNSETIPSWNYKTVQVKGIIKKLIDDELEVALISMLNKYEENLINNGTFNNETNLNIRSLDSNAVAIFEIEVSDCKAAFKLSQNKDEKECLNIVRELKKQDDFNSMLIAFEMEQELKNKKRLK